MNNTTRRQCLLEMRADQYHLWFIACHHQPTGRYFVFAKVVVSYESAVASAREAISQIDPNQQNWKLYSEALLDQEICCPVA